MVSVRVQRLAGETSVSYTVVGEDALPVAPIEAYLVHLVARGKSPATVKAYAQDLKDLFVWLGQRGQDFAEVELEDLAQFVAWLRRPVELRQPGVFVLPGSPSALDAATLLRKRAALAGFYRFHAVRGSAKAVLGGATPGARHATGDYLPVLAHTMRGPVEHSPLRLPAGGRKRPRELSDDEVTLLQDACLRLRDRFLVTLLYESGLRIGEALGLRHADLDPAEEAVHVVPREDNPNLARVKEMKARSVPVRGYLFQRYADYLDVEFGELDSDFVFVNLWRGHRGAAMTYSAVADLELRLRKRTGVDDLTWHALRHTYATRLLRSGTPIEVVAELLGHESTETTKSIYSHLTLGDYRRILTESGVLDGGPVA
ncbi:tyrosine-type recombinase/integrase [Saccharothrix syringae]|uniref:tyrosine-type recombinase/integrase n=1 Tax=Saccharothrix syringae TaxID=103733 RepID=UPI002AD3CCFB|nr:tyrosine-type recombinase/integrase [Saccharothrix syringae]